MSRAGRALKAMLLGVISIGPAAAAKLDKETCAGLASELATLTASGIKSEMDRGASWCLSNLPPDRLHVVKRVLEIEDQLEFRCNVRSIAPRRKDNPVVPAAAGQTLDARATGTPPVTTMPTAVAAPKAPPSISPVAAPAAPTTAVTNNVPATRAVAPAATAPVAAAVSPAAAAVPAVAAPNAATVGVTTKALPTTAIAPPSALGAPPKANPVMAANPPATMPVAAHTAPVTLAPAATTALPAPGPAATVVPGAKKSVDPAALAAAKKKNSRRASSSAYVPAGAVDEYSLPGMR